MTPEQERALLEAKIANERARAGMQEARRDLYNNNASANPQNISRQLTQGEKDELIYLMQNMKADENFVNKYGGYLNPGENIFTNPAAILRTLPSIEQNFGNLPPDFQKLIIEGGRARDQANFMGASGGRLVTPNIRSGGLLADNMPDIDFGIDEYARAQSEAVQQYRGVEPDVPMRSNDGTVTSMPAPSATNNSVKPVFGSLLDAMIPVGEKIAQKRGFTQDSTNQNAVNLLQTVPQPNGVYENPSAVTSGFLDAQNYPLDNRLRPDLPPRVGPFDPMNPDIVSVESFDPVDAERQRDLRAAQAAKQQSRLVQGSFSGDLGINKNYPIVSNNSQININNANKQINDLKRSGTAPEVIDDLEIKKSEAESTPSDPYKWQNFFSSAAIAFDNLRMPSMRNPALVKTMQEQINFNRSLVKNNRTADQIEALGTPQAKILANAIRNQSITPKDAFTAIYKNKSMPEELLEMMENNPVAFEKIAPFLSGQGFGTMQSSILSNALKLADDSRAKAQSSADVFRGVERIQSVIAEFANDTGPWAETKKNILQTLAGYGLNFNESYLADAQSLDSASNALVAAQLRLNKGPQTDFDALFTQSFIPSLKNTTAANQKMISYMKSNSLVDMLIDEAVQSVGLSPNNPSAYQKSIKDILSLRSNKDIGVIIKVKDADPNTGQEAMFKTFEEFVNDYRNAEPNANPLEILNSWKDVTQKARRSLKTKAL